MKTKLVLFLAFTIMLAMSSCTGASKGSGATSVSVSSQEVETQDDAGVADSLADSTATSQDVDDNQAASSQAKLVVLDFYATWCGPCKAMAPAMEKMEKKYGDRIEFRKIDVDQEPELAEKYQISAIPTLVVLSAEGNILDRMSGAQTEGELDKMFGAML